MLLQDKQSRKSRKRSDFANILLCSLCLILSTTSTHAQSAYADMVCSAAGGCIEGKVASKAGVQISIPAVPNSTLPSTALLLPGTYSSASTVTSANNASLLSPFLLSSSSTLQTNTGFTGTPSTSTTANTITVDQPSGLLIYSSSLFSGQSSLLSYNDTFITNATSTFTPLSSILSNDLFVVAEIPTSRDTKKQERVVFWTSVPDVNELPMDVKEGPWTITSMQSSKCSPACASGGVCARSGKCVCEEGFTGDTCNECAPGRFGPSCTLCSSCPNGTCEEGITGTGRCIPLPLKPAAEACNCVNGVCAAGSSDCSCNPGWADANGGQQCSVCATGFYLSNEGECLACGSGCTSCAASTGTCSTCQPNLQPSQDNPRTCIPQQFLPANGTAFTSCPAGSFLSNAATQTCIPCSSACEECFGTESNQCLKCARSRGLLESTCVSVDTGTGICDGSAFDSGNAVAWLLNPATAVCDPLPPGCTAGRVNNFSSTSSRSDIQCTQCLEGLVLNGNECTDTCPSGTFATTTGATTACQPCSTSCSTCEGSAGFCLTCPGGQLTVNGACIISSTCPSGTFQTNSTAPCSSCHPDCATCSESSSKCTSCPPPRPVLTSSGTCVLACAPNEYLETASGTCSKCDTSCGTCYGSSSGKCLSCTGNTVLKAGACVPAKCENMTPLGVCLQDLAVIKSKTTLDETPKEDSKKLPGWVYAVIAVGVVALLGLLLLLWRMRAIKKRMGKTKGFQAKRGLFSFFNWRKRKNSQGEAETESSKSTTIHLHNNVELARSPTPPSYHFATTAVHPDLYKPPVMSAYADTASNYSLPRGPESRFWPQEANDRQTMASESSMSNISFDWPPVKPNIECASGSKESFRSPLLRESGLSNSGSSRAASSTGAKRFGTIDFSREIELQERRKALSKLTGSDLSA